MRDQVNTSDAGLVGSDKSWGSDLLLDSSKAFDKVLIYALQTNSSSMASEGRPQSGFKISLLDGSSIHSKWSLVTSGVPQGSVLGPTLFLVYINGIVSDINSTLRLFADDSILYIEVTCPEDQVTLQKDLNKVFQWADEWQMCFNALKCETLTITRKLKPLNHAYEVNGQHIVRSSKHKYLVLL